MQWLIGVKHKSFLMIHFRLLENHRKNPFLAEILLLPKMSFYFSKQSCLGTPRHLFFRCSSSLFSLIGWTVTSKEPLPPRFTKLSTTPVHVLLIVTGIRYRSIAALLFQRCFIVSWSNSIQIFLRNQTKHISA